MLTPLSCMQNILILYIYCCLFLLLVFLKAYFKSQLFHKLWPNPLVIINHLLFLIRQHFTHVTNTLFLLYMIVCLCLIIKNKKTPLIQEPSQKVHHKYNWLAINLLFQIYLFERVAAKGEREREQDKSFICCFTLYAGRNQPELHHSARPIDSLALCTVSHRGLNFSPYIHMSQPKTYFKAYKHFLSINLINKISRLEPSQ